MLHRYRRKLPSFDDDIQGTGAVVAAGIRSGCMLAGRSLEDERIVFFGAGASGAGCALALRSAMRSAGVTEDELSRRVLVLDSQGLILRDRPGLDGHKLDLAADPALVSRWKSDRPDRFGLIDVVRGFEPTTLVGVSGQPSSFTEEIVRAMLAKCPRPIILCLSNPTNKTEARPEDLLRWTAGAAIVATGSPFPPVSLNGRQYRIGQGNNALIFPGFGLGALAVEARWLPDSAFDAAAQALFEYAAPGIREGAPIFPPLSKLREVSRVVARAVGLALVDAGAAPVLTPDVIDARIEAARWEPDYVRYRAETSLQ